MLVDGQTRIFDSTIIMDYIEERGPTHRCCLMSRPPGHLHASPRTCAIPNKKR